MRAAGVACFAAVLLAASPAGRSLAADAPSWRIAGTRATPLHVRLVQRLRDHDAEDRVRLLELDALLADEGQAPWAGGAPVLEGRPDARGPWVRVTGAAQTAWLTADGSPWPPAPGDSVRTPRLRATFEGDSIAAAGIDGPWRLTFATVPEGETGQPSVRWYEGFTAPLRAMQFGDTDWFVRAVERVRGSHGRARVRVAIESSVAGTASFRLRAWPEGGGGANEALPAEQRMQVRLKPGMNRETLDLSFEGEAHSGDADRPLRFELLDAETGRRLWPR